ncbi:MAG: hypothetical protein HY902_13990 [Deltaproteobacteria bacterium]|nr:hypothetical protein [Deltaproteobacteria bacterium]
MSASGLQLGDGWLLMPQPSPLLAVCRLEPRDGQRAIAALPPSHLPTNLGTAQVVLRTGERRCSPQQLQLLPIANALCVTLTEAVPLEHWHGARLELHAKPG